ncbi:hypothetical protein [Planomonospora algeriensis]
MSTTTDSTTGNPLVVVSAELIPAAARWATEDMMIVASQLDQLHEWPFLNATALKILTDRLEADYPINTVVTEAMRNLFIAQAQLINPAREIGALFRRVHLEEILRREAPRRGERKWNHV